MSKDEKWKSSLLIEIAGEAWRDEPELLGAVGSACDLLEDVAFVDGLVAELTEQEIGEVRDQMAGIRDALMRIWVALDNVSPATTCLGTLCVEEGDHGSDQRRGRRRDAH